MLDISLELKGKGGEVSSAENTLGACLRRLVPTVIRLSVHVLISPKYRFTQPEKLGSKEYSCGKCAKASHVRHSHRHQWQVLS